MFKKCEFENDIFLTDEDFGINGDITLLPSICDVDVNNLLEDEDTLEAGQKFDPQFEPIFVPKSPVGPPDTVSFAGHLNFAVEIKSSETDQKKFLYSGRLNRIYVDMGVNFPVHFSWDVQKQGLLSAQAQDLYIRATVVFSDDSQAEKRVERCLQHVHEREPNNPGVEAVVRNVLRSTRAMGTSGVYYCGAPHRADSWFSVLVHLPAPAGHAYQFVCKNSCSSGINRRNIAILFTLEDHHGKVLGRQSVGARVCACPKRDLRRDEEVTKGKRRTNHAPADTLKKVKIEVVQNNDEVVTLPKIPIKGIKTVMTGLEVMQRMMELSASEAARRNDQAAVDEYRNCLGVLGAALDNLKKSSTSPQQTQ